MKVVIVGTGNVGMSYAYALVNQPSKVDELVLIDINNEKAKGEAMDLNHALPFAPTKIKIKAGSYADCENAQIIVICAGRNQNPGETRLDLINKNLEVFKDVIFQIKRSNFKGIYLIATNPVDIMSYVTYKLTGDSTKVIGSGTTLDTARLKHLVGEKLKISPKNIHAYVVGEHGDSEMIPWSKATIGVKDVKDYLSKTQMLEIQKEVRESAYDIISKKGNTSYGIGVCLLKITESILTNDNSILTLSTYNKKHDIYISTPTIMSIKGVRDQIEVDFSDEELKQYENSISVIKNVVDKINFD
ncbi:MAG: L-lactate dehydrogenase [Spirochaetales bacterium]